jgi:hypothetical protein
VNQRRNDFESLVMVKKPQELDFSDKAENSKIKEMEALIAETIAKRNFDIEQINTNMNTNQNTGQNTDEWLKPNNTSLKTEKQQQQQQIQNDTSQRKQKYTNVLEQEPPSFLTKSDSAMPVKKVSFNETNNMTMTIEEYMEPEAQEVINIPTNIFNKLKKVTEPIKNSEPNIQAQINDMNKKIDTLFTMMSELSSNVKQIISFKQDK